MIVSDRPLFQPSPAEREQVLEAIRQALEARPDVLFAYVHGSFLEDRPAHDVDVAVYLAPGTGEHDTMVAPAMAPAVAAALAADLEKAIRPVYYLPVDVRLLNEAPTAFRYHAFRGRLLFSRDEEVRSAMVERTVAIYLDRKPLLDQALKEAMTA
ncbi:MAG: nucleotidyltransferase domain-containing protein [Anaerolineae bacterium]